MSYTLSLFFIFCFTLVESFVVHDNNFNISNQENISKNLINLNNNVPENVFNGVYTECFLHLSYSCLQEKTLLYLKELNKLSEVSVLGEYVKFVKINESEDGREFEETLNNSINGPEDLSIRIDRAVDHFFNGHILKFNAFGKYLSVPNTVEEFVGRKRKGGGGGGGGHGGHDDGGKKKMMMMAMMCMKMKLMMMVPAMMGMMGMMSFKGMMFSMMSFMVSKMMLLMKILEKKGLGGGGGDGGGWAAGGGGGGGGGGGAWMPAGGQDYGGGGGGGYDANGQWQSRAIAGFTENGPIVEQDPIFTYIPPLVRANHRRGDKFYSTIKKLNGNAIKVNNDVDNSKTKSRKKRGIVDILQNAYLYWLNQILGPKSQKILPRYPKYKLINGVRYVYYPIRYVKKPKQLNPQIEVKPITPIVASEDFNKGEILEGPSEVVESRTMNMKKMKKLANDINEVIEQDPWE